VEHSAQSVYLLALLLAPRPLTCLPSARGRLLDDNRELYVPELQETVRPHPHFMLFATQNPAGAYGGRKARPLAQGICLGAQVPSHQRCACSLQGGPRACLLM
jgi:hypothetical protein